MGRAMTCYFDRMHARVNAARLLSERERWPVLAEIERELAWDTTIAAELLPLEAVACRDAIHRTIVRWGTTGESLPLDPATLTCRFPDLGDDPDGEFAERLDQLCWDLHTVFHDVARLGGSDEPSAPLRALYARGEARREDMLR